MTVRSRNARGTGGAIPLKGHLGTTAGRGTTGTPAPEAYPASEAYNVVSLFSGCGGADLGFQGGFGYLNDTFEPLPFRISWANDVDRFAVAVYRHNLTAEISDSDIAHVNFESLNLPPTDVLVAGFPCQEFALLGPRGGLRSKRGQLYKHVRRALRALRPKLFLVENVPGIEHPQSTLRIVTRGLAGRSPPQYHVEVFRINAGDYGVPQVRRRVLLIGVRSDLRGCQFVKPKPVRADPREASTLNVQPWVTAKVALDDLWCGAGPETSPVADQAKVTNAAMVLDKPKRRDKRLEPDQPSPTIRAEHHGHVELHYRLQDDGSLRHLTVRECARLQGFPDSFAFPVSFTQAYRQIGNAMPPVLVHHWANSILVWLRRLETEQADSQQRSRGSHRDPQMTSKIMAAVRNRGSKAELALGKAMWRAGLRYRKHPRGIHGNPDYAFLSQKVAIFCDGDFWHGLGWKERGFSTWDEQFEHLRNAEFWREKIRRNMERDKEVNEELRSSGWIVLRLRETEILKDPDKCAAVVRDAIAAPGTPFTPGQPAVGARWAREDKVASQIPR